MNRSVKHKTLSCMVGGLAVLLAACSESPSEPTQMVDNGSWYRSGYLWPHDGNPYESENFIVFSDAASLQARQKLAEIAEGLMDILVDDFQIDPETMFKWPPGQSKLHIYAYKNHYEQSFGGKGYYGGLMMWSLDHPIRDTGLANYTKVVKHELMHAIEGVLKGTDNPKLVDVWLSEGIAEYVSGGTNSSGNITTLAKLDSLVAVRGEINPITMHFYEDFPPNKDFGYLYLYAMFETSVRYLLDPAGLGFPESAIRDVIIEAGAGAPFADVFEEKFGLGLKTYEDEFWGRIRAFLN